MDIKLSNSIIANMSLTRPLNLTDIEYTIKRCNDEKNKILDEIIAEITYNHNCKDKLKLRSYVSKYKKQSRQFN